MKSLFKSGLAVFLLLTFHPAFSDQLGRLFFTPEQRKKMEYDYARLAKPEADENRALTLNGIVQRQGGKRTAWINGKPQEVGPSNDRTPESVQVTIPGKKKSVRLKVGQRVLLSPDAGSEKALSDLPDTGAKK